MAGAPRAIPSTTPTRLAGAASGSDRIGRIDYEVRNFVDGKRSILDIRNAVSAEYEPVPLKSIENYLLVLEKTGFVKVEKR